MAQQRKIAIQEIRQLSYQIAYHIVKIITVNSSRDKKHWIGEVNGWLHTVNNIYIKKKLPFNVYYEVLWDGWLGHEDAALMMMQGTNYRPNQYTTTKDTDTNIQQIYIAICRDIVNNVRPIKLERYLPQIKKPS